MSKKSGQSQFILGKSEDNEFTARLTKLKEAPLTSLDRVDPALRTAEAEESWQKVAELTDEEAEAKLEAQLRALKEDVPEEVSFGYGEGVICDNSGGAVPFVCY